MAFKDLSQVFDDTLSLPVGGKVYRIPPPDPYFGLWIQQLLEMGFLIQQGKTAEEIGDLPPFRLPDGSVITAENGKVGEDNALYRRMLGDVWDELHADGVSWPKIQMVSQTAMFWVGIGLEAAEAFWNSGGNPEALAPNRQARRSKSTVGADTAKKRASGSSTTSRRTSTGRSARKS